MKKHEDYFTKLTSELPKLDDIKNHDIVSYEESPEKIKEHLLKYEIIFALDFNSLKRIGILSKEIEKNNLPIIMIDHHESPEKFSTLSLSNHELALPVKFQTRNQLIIS